MSDEKKTEQKKEPTIGAKLAETAEGKRREAERKRQEEAKKEFEAWLPGSDKAIHAFCEKHLAPAALAGKRSVDMDVFKATRELGLKDTHAFDYVIPLLVAQELSVRDVHDGDGTDPYLRISF